VLFISDQSNNGAQADPFRAPALHHFVDVEQKHRELFGAVQRASELGSAL